MSYKNQMKTFDWVKAAKIIKEMQPVEASAGILDYENKTAGVIYRDGKIIKDTHTFLSSTWATPVLIIKIPCYNYGTDTKWPEEAVNELT